MPHRLSTSQPDFEARFAQLLASREALAPSVAASVADILRDVRERGDAALIDYTRRFDRFEVSAATLRVSESEIEAATASVPAEVRRALEVAAARIRAYSEKQLPADLDYADAHGVRLGHRWSAIASVGLYVPGGLAAYPSSVLMNAVPAKVAGVKRLAMAVPAPEGKLAPAVLAAARMAGVDEVYRVGGAQAVAALAFGTQAVAPVDKIVGPGNAWVAEAKRQVFGVVGIDMIAGPSEILVISDAASNPAWVAADLLSQAEHDAQAQSILITDDAAFADAVAAEAERTLAALPRRDIAGASWRDHGAIIVCRSLAEAAALADRLAPEHLELAVEAPEALAQHIRHAGAFFLGRHTPEAIGDYVAGPSHVLPTSRTARFSSGLSVFDFLKRSSLVALDGASLAALGPHAVALADAEGLGAHALSVRVRAS